jgi:hypothetical protein
MQKNNTRLRPLTRLAVRLLRQKGYSINQVSFALHIDVNSISSLSNFSSLKEITLQELGNPSDNTDLLAAAVESAMSWLDSLPSVQALYREGPRGRALHAATTTSTASPSPMPRRPVGRPRKAPKTKAA